MWWWWWWQRFHFKATHPRLPSPDSRVSSLASLSLRHCGSFSVCRGLANAHCSLLIARSISSWPCYCLVLLLLCLSYSHLDSQTPLSLFITVWAYSYHLLIASFSSFVNPLSFIAYVPMYIESLESLLLCKL